MNTSCTAYKYDALTDYATGETLSIPGKSPFWTWAGRADDRKETFFLGGISCVDICFFAMTFFLSADNISFSSELSNFMAGSLSSERPHRKSLNVHSGAALLHVGGSGPPPATPQNGQTRNQKTGTLPGGCQFNSERRSSFTFKSFFYFLFTVFRSFFLLIFFLDRCKTSWRWLGLGIFWFICYALKMVSWG